MTNAYVALSDFRKLLQQERTATRRDSVTAWKEVKMGAGIVIPAVLLTCICASAVRAQDIETTSISAPNSNLTQFLATPVGSSTDETIPLKVPKGTAVQVVLDKEVRIHKVGQTIHGLVAEPVYAFRSLRPSKADRGQCRD
jgi:hypothetical protein